MADKVQSLGGKNPVTAMTKNDCILIEVGGAIRRIKLSDLASAIQTNQLDLSLIAWGTYLKETSDPQWGKCGNQTKWNEVKASFGRYLLTNDGKMAKLSRSNSAYFEDGTAVDESKGHVMWHTPHRIYYLVKYDASVGCNVLWGSLYPISEHYIDHPTFGAYMAGLSGGKLTSRSGLNVLNNISLGAVGEGNSGPTNNFFYYARLNGKDFGTLDYETLKIIPMLVLWESGSSNAQAKFGCGPTGSTNTWDKVNGLTTGATKSLGDNNGTISLKDLTGNADACHVNLFGIENPWGWYWQMIQGIYFGSSNNSGQTGTEAFVYNGNRMPTASELTGHPVGDYRTFARNTNNGGVQKLVLGDYFDIMPKTVGGENNSAYYCDYSWANSTGHLLLFGGDAWNALTCGSFCVASSDVFGLRGANCGVRLAFYGNPTYVNGADL